MLPPIALLNASPVTFSLVYPARCCSLHSPSTFLSQSFCTCYSLSVPCSSLLRLTAPLHSGPCSNATSSDRLLLLSMSKAASPYPFCLVLCFSYIRNFIMTSHYRIFYMRPTRGVVMSTDWGTELRLYSSFTTYQLCSLDKWFRLSVLQSLPL